jgi:hypothetical protein
MRITSRKRAGRAIVSCLTCRLPDQSQLMGVLKGLAELHLPILNVQFLEGDNGGS